MRRKRRGRAAAVDVRDAGVTIDEPIQSKIPRHRHSQEESGIENRSLATGTPMSRGTDDLSSLAAGTPNDTKPRCGNTEYWVQIDGTLDWTNKHSLAGFHDDLRQNGTCLQDQRFNAKSANCGTSLVSYVFGYHPQQTDAKHTNMYNEVSPVGLLCEYFSMKRNIGYCRILFTALLSRASLKW